MIAIGDVKRWLNVQTADQDDLLVALEETTADFVQRETGRYFGPVITFTQYIDGNGRDTIWLDEPATTITSVAERTSGVTWLTYPSSDYEQDGRKLFLIDSAWPKGRRNLRVIYTFGYATDMEPAEIRQAVLDIIALRYRARGTEGFQSRSIAEYSFTRATLESSPKGTDVCQILDRWKGAWLG